MTTRDDGKDDVIELVTKGELDEVKLELATMAARFAYLIQSIESLCSTAEYHSSAIQHLAIAVGSSTVKPVSEKSVVDSMIEMPALTKNNEPSKPN